MALTVGTRLGPYEITAQIGAGGMGEVYKATDTRLHRTVAVKVLPDHVASNPDLKQRFEREAQALAALSHPHICPVFDVGSQSGIAFLVMEYLEGETLEQRLKKGKLPLDQALQIGIQIADALAAAHRAGIVHRDFKPGNIMLTRSGAKLLDFGLAKTTTAAVAVSLSMLPTTSPGLTQQGIFWVRSNTWRRNNSRRGCGSANGYLRVRCSVPRDGHRQAGIRGQEPGKPHQRDSENDPRPISTLQPLAPPLLERIVAKCLLKEADGRWQSATDLRDELQWVARAPVVSTAPHLAGGGNRVAWMVAGVALVTAAVGLRPRGNRCTVIGNRRTRNAPGSQHAGTV